MTQEKEGAINGELVVSGGGELTRSPSNLVLRGLATLDKQEAEAYAHQSLVYFREGDYDSAIAYCNRALEIDPSCAEAYSIRGGAYYMKCNYDAAIADYSRALEINPNAGAYNCRGVAYSNKGNYDAAIADYSRALEIDPNYVSAYLNRGGFYSNKGNYEVAIADYSRALAIKPNYVDVYIYRGLIYYNEGNYDDAIADYSRALEIDPKDSRAYSNRDIAVKRRQEKEEALQHARALPLTVVGMEMIPIPAGDFLMGDDDWSDNPRRTVYLDSYLIAQYPVTVKQYMAFVKATGYREPSKPSWGWQEDHPVVNVSWEDAEAYCAWASKECGRKVTLPTEAQWEKASRGTDGRKYPWGNEWDSSRLQCSKESYGDPGSTAAVGSFPTGTSPYGVLDMAGNVWEWCSDWYDSGYMKTATTRNPTGSSKGSARVLRGGSWYDGSGVYFRCAYRGNGSPDYWVSNWGFRCAVPADSH